MQNFCFCGAKNPLEYIQARRILFVNIPYVQTRYKVCLLCEAEATHSDLLYPRRQNIDNKSDIYIFEIFVSSGF